MIDWLHALVGYDASNLNLGVVYAVDPSGQCLWERPVWNTAVGSFESTFQVRVAEPSAGTWSFWRQQPFLASPRCLELSGNPSKFTQGHNVVGPSVELLGPVVQAVVRGLGAARPANADSGMLPCVHRSRVDITTAVDLGSHEAVHEHLRVLAAVVRSHQSGAVAYPDLSRPETVCFQQGSRRWSLKVYCKFCELGAHPPKLDAAFLQELRSWSTGHLRFELQLRRPELVARGTLSESLIWDFYCRLRLPVMSDYGVGADILRANVKLAFEHWLDRGPGALDVLPRATMYRYRSQILKATGIDVLLPREGQSAAARRVLLSVDELKAREVKDIPEPIQASIWKPLR